MPAGRTQVPLFPGDCELRQLLHIFKLLGTPTEAQWAGVSDLRDWHEFPNWRKQDLSKHFPTLGADGIDLMERMFAYTPIQRITVRARASADSPPLPSLLCADEQSCQTVHHHQHTSPLLAPTLSHPCCMQGMP